MPGTCSWLVRSRDNPLGAALEHQVPGWVRGRAPCPQLRHLPDVLVIGPEIIRGSLEHHSMMSGGSFTGVRRSFEELWNITR